MQARTAACLLLIFLRTLAGMYLRGDHTEGLGDIQKVDEDEIELVDEDDEELPEDREKFATEELDGVARSFGDFW